MLLACILLEYFIVLVKKKNIVVIVNKLFNKKLNF